MDENKNFPDNVSFDIDEKITVVETKEENKKAKLPLIIGLCVLIVIIIAGIIIFAVKNNKKPAEEEFSGNNPVTENISLQINEEADKINKNEEEESKRDQLLADATTQLSQDVGNQSPNEIVEPSTSGSQTTPETPTADSQQTEKAEEQIKAFFNKKYHMKGAMYDKKGKGDSFSISQNGENLEAMSNLDGIEVSIMRLDGVIYFKRPALKQYTVLTESLMNFMGFDKDFFNLDFGDTNYDTMKDKLVSVYDVTINGAPGVCYLYKSDEQQFKFFAQDGNLKQIEIYDNTGELTSQMMISYFTTSIPSDHLTFKGYTETTFGALFSDVLKEEMQ